jgi:acetylornithine/succinyldiaminopimelate/putrescine aminotransferase
VAATGLAGGGPWRDPFPDLWLDTVHVAPDDLQALDDALDASPAAAFILEVVQATGGGAAWSPEALLQAGEACRCRGTLMILDEVLTGLGRTGRWFAFHTAGDAFQPDMVVVSKALTGGLVPISAVLMTDPVYEATFREGRAKIHGSTFSGSRLATACGLAVLDLIEEEGVLDRVWLSSQALRLGLERLALGGLIGQVRGSGLALGVEILGEEPAAAAAACCLDLMDRGVLTNIAAHAPQFLKLTPPLTISLQEIAHFEQELGAALTVTAG